VKQLLPLALSVNTIAVMWLAGSKRPAGWALGLAGQAGWVAFVILFQAWGLLPLTVVLTGIYARNLIRWRREERLTRETP
jgi:hypothetical protein